MTNNSQHGWMLHVVSVCTPCWMWLRVVAQSLNPVKLFSQQLPTFPLFRKSPKRSATMLDPFAQLFQHCWGHASSLRMGHKELWVVSFPRCTVGLNIVGSCCIRRTLLPTRTQQLPTLLAQQSWELLRPFVCSLKVF